MSIRGFFDFFVVFRSSMTSSILYCLHLFRIISGPLKAVRFSSSATPMLSQVSSSGSVSLSSSHHRYDPAGRGISCSPASLKQSISIRSNDSSGASTGGRLNLSSRYSYILVLLLLSNVEISGYDLQVLFRKIIKF